MKRICLVGVALATVLIAPSSAVAMPNLVKNGGFEQPKVAAGSFHNFNTGETIAGWTVVGEPGSQSLVSKTFTQNGFTFPSKSGKQWLDLTGTSQTATGVAQTVATTSGTNYKLSFWVGNLYDPSGIFGVSSTINVLVNGTPVFSATNAKQPATKTQEWQKFTITVPASSGSTTLTFINGDPANDTLDGLDAVSFKQI